MIARLEYWWLRQQIAARNGIANTERWWLRKQITTRHRARMYRTLVLLLRSNVRLIDALTKMHVVYSDYGKNPKAPMAQLVLACRETVGEGRPFRAAIKDWVSVEEAALIAAGEESGDLKRAFEDAIKLVATKNRLTAAIAEGTVQPAVYTGLLAYMMYTTSTQVVPEFARLAPVETWEGSAKAMHIMSIFTVTYGWLTLGVVLALVVAVHHSLPRLTGNWRYRLERIPPWSIYRVLVGAPWMQTIAVMNRAGIPLIKALAVTRATATPYLRERIDGTKGGLIQGVNLGVALRDAAYDFPDREAIGYIELLAGVPGFDTALEDYAAEWTDLALDRVNKAATVFRYGAIVATAGVVLLVYAAGADLQTAVQAALNAR